MTDDCTKITFLCQSTEIDIDGDDVISIKRIGKRHPNKNRPLKIVMKSSNKNINYKKGNIAADPNIRCTNVHVKQNVY